MKENVIDKLKGKKIKMGVEGELYYKYCFFFFI